MPHNITLRYCISNLAVFWLLNTSVQVHDGSSLGFHCSMSALSTWNGNWGTSCWKLHDSLVWKSWVEMDGQQTQNAGLTQRFRQNIYRWRPIWNVTYPLSPGTQLDPSSYKSILWLYVINQYLHFLVSKHQSKICMCQNIVLCMTISHNSMGNLI